MCHIEHRPFGCIHHRDRSQPYHQQTISRFLISDLARRDPNNTSRIANVFYDTLVCSAVHSAEIDDGLRKDILASIKSDEALKAVESVIFQDSTINALVGTTRAVDIVGGGVKA